MYRVWLKHFDSQNAAYETGTTVGIILIFLQHLVEKLSLHLHALPTFYLSCKYIKMRFYCNESDLSEKKGKRKNIKFCLLKRLKKILIMKLRCWKFWQGLLTHRIGTLVYTNVCVNRQCTLQSAIDTQLKTVYQYCVPIDIVHFKMLLAHSIKNVNKPVVNKGREKVVVVHSKGHNKSQNNR